MTSSSPGSADGSAAPDRKAPGGDGAAFRELYRRHAPLVHGVLVASVAPDDADDLMQEAFLVAWRKRDQVRDADRSGAWLAAIARNLARHHHARAPRPCR